MPSALYRAGLVNGIFRGDVYDRWNNAEARYPAVDFDLLNVSKVNDDLKQYTLRVYVADRLYDDGQGYNGNPVGITLEPATENGHVPWLLTSYTGSTNDQRYADVVRLMSNENYDAGYTCPMLPITNPLPALLKPGTELVLPIAKYLPPKVTAYGTTVDLLADITSFRGQVNHPAKIGLMVATGGLATGSIEYDGVVFNRLSSNPSLEPIVWLFTDDGDHYRIPEAVGTGGYQMQLLDYLRTWSRNGERKTFGYVVLAHNYGLSFFYPEMGVAFDQMPNNIRWGMKVSPAVDTYLLDTCEAAVDSLIAELRKDNDVINAEYTTLIPFEQKFADNLAGYYTDINIVLPNSLNIC